MKILKVSLKDNPYPIFIGQKSLHRVAPFIRKHNLGNFALIITTEKIHSLYKKIISKTFSGIKHKVVTVIDGERAKSKEWFFKVISEAIKADSLDRRMIIVCLGGGVVGDLGGFLAAVYKRGTPCIQIPTTLLAQIDSSIGGKTAIDVDEAKNILGAFHQPRAVFIDPDFLATLSEREFRQGMAEAIKYGIIKDKDFFHFLMDNSQKVKNLNSKSILRLITTCASIKADIVSKDEREKKGLRTILNFGHTFGHALESYLGYGKISHGEAVGLGMYYAAQLSFVLGKCSKGAVQELAQALKLFSLPIGLKFDPQAVYNSLIYDKKFISGTVRMVLLKRMGRVEVVSGISRVIIQKTLRGFGGGQC